MDDASKQFSLTSYEGEVGSERLPTTERWLLLEGDRRLVAVVILLGLVVVLGVLLWSGVAAVRNQNSLTRLFASLAGGNLTLITVVITINQLMLSREFGTPAEFHERISGILAYRSETEAAADADVSPVTPEAFLAFVVYQLNETAESILAESDAIADDETRAAVENYAESLCDQSDTIHDQLTDHTWGTFGTLLTVLDVDFTTDRYMAERLYAKGDGIPDRVEASIADTSELLTDVGAARQYFKTLSMQRELADLSQRILYTGIPAVTTSVLAVWLYGHDAGASLSPQVLAGVVLVATAVAFSPLAVLFAYILRVTTLERMTMALFPFETHELARA